MTKKERFLKQFDSPLIDEISVQVTVPDCPEPETITNKRVNFEGKKKYYEKAYNDNLELISFPKIKIVGCAVKSQDKVAYLCDAEKFIECDKAYCYTNGGDCYLSTDAKYTQK